MNTLNEMAASNSSVIEKFIQGKKGSNENHEIVFIPGGRHLLYYRTSMAYISDALPGIMFINTSKYSVSTSKFQSEVRSFGYSSSKAPVVTVPVKGNALNSGTSTYHPANMSVSVESIVATADFNFDPSGHKRAAVMDCYAARSEWDQVSDAWADEKMKLIRSLEMIKELTN
jgi:hypothetical protein